MKVNGKELSVVMDELRAPLPKEAFSEKNGYPSLKYVAVVKRLEEVVSFNYRFKLQLCDVAVVEGQANVVTQGELVLLCDDGSVAFSTSGTGACRVIISNETKEPINLANDRESAVHDCFKRCAKSLGIGAEQLRQMRKNRKGKSDTESVAVDAEVISKFSWRGTGISAKVRINNDEYDLVIWQDKHKLLEDYCGSVTEFMKRCRRGAVLHCVGTFSDYKGAKQFVLSDFNTKKDGEAA